MANAGSLSGLIKFIHRTEWNEILAKVLAQHLGACDKFGVEPQYIADILGDAVGSTLWGCALEDLMAREFDGGRNVVDEYLRRRGYAESGGARRYMHALRSAVMSIYEISDVAAGRSFLARDLVRGGEPVRVLEVSGSKSLKSWDRIGARVVRLGPEWRMSGGVLLLEREASEFLVEALKGISDGRLPDDLREHANRIIGPGPAAKLARDLADRLPLELAAATITGIWLSDALDRALNPRLPVLHNTDGHPIVICTSTFAARPAAKPATCRKLLAATPGLVQDSTRLFSWLRAAGAEPKPPPQTGQGVVLMATSSTGQTLLGSIEIKGRTIVLSTNSRERAKAGEAMIAAALGELVGAPSRQEITAEEALAETKSRTRRKPRPEVPREEARIITHAHLDRHYRQTLDEPIPALGNVSPREAVLGDTGRAKVVDWLKGMENHSAKAGGGKDPMASYDFGWIWRELGIAELRQ